MQAHQDCSEHSSFPVKARIPHKIACLCFECIYQNSVPPYISDLLRPYCPSRTLCCLDTSLLTVPRFSLETFGKRFFFFFFFGICTCSVPLSMCHRERRSRNTLIIIIIIKRYKSRRTPQRFQAVHLFEWGRSKLGDHFTRFLPLQTTAGL